MAHTPAAVPSEPPLRSRRRLSSLAQDRSTENPSSGGRDHHHPSHTISPPRVLALQQSEPATTHSWKEAARKQSLDALNGTRPSQSPPKARQDTPRPRRSSSIVASTEENNQGARRRSTDNHHHSMAGDAGVDVGDTVEVPGGMTGTVRFVGPVRGKAGVFAGVELSSEFAQRGKNDGDVDGVHYFSTSIPGSGIFLPSHRAVKLASPTLSSSSFPPTPTTPSFNNFDLAKQHGANHHTPPTPSLPKFSQSVGPGSRPSFSRTVGHGGRAPSPQQKLRPRPSLPRPNSPSRTTSGQAPGSARPSNAGFSQSVRNGRAMTASPAPTKFAPAKPQPPASVRSPSRSTSQLSNRSPGEKARPYGHRLSNGGQSHPGSQGSSAAELAAANQESQRLQRSLDERDRQLREQATSLAEMESSLSELQLLMAESKGLESLAGMGGNGGGGGGGGSAELQAAGSDVSQLRALLREKNEKISMLTAEFDGHRADFRSTIDTLEMASSETERVYEKRVQELLQEVQDLQDRGQDVESFARQLKQLEDLVAELEEGLEDARRGEAEARSEVEFLRGEVERGRSELRREREKAAKALKPDSKSPSREVEARDDEIRGLKAIIHSLSSGSTNSSQAAEQAQQADPAIQDEMARLKEQMETMQRERGELQTLVERKNVREEELERELARLRDTGSNPTTSRPQSTAKSFRSAHEHSDSITSTQTAIRPTSLSRDSGPGPADSTPALPTRSASRPKSGSRLSSSAGLNDSTIPEGPETNGVVRATSPAPDRDEFHEVSETASSAGASAAVCDFCEQKGHDVLSCPNVNTSAAASGHAASHSKDDIPRPAPLRSVASSQTLEVPPSVPPKDDAKGATSQVKMPELGGDGPVAGRESRVIDMTKWCAMCEKDGHESVDCPFEDF